ncbi:putative tRNA 2-thiouridine synthesizing protein A [Magnetofaba australis IT-1]|uniref:Putative tRNA 2-thiouridine synthesizing protein A n=1 Tax=Magnetofaba australis IT-1 TaxID=1434232 RepID=A0A1Y2K764_9PROT|nr:putative tRNA 2-thiouridine synthesizing protein A [Magnetofaba australis IT-1]
MKTRKLLKGMNDGEVLRVTATDPGSAQDMRAFCEQTGTEMMSATEEGGEYRFLLRKH